MFNWIRASRTRRPAPSRSTHSRTRSRLALEPLEDRTTPTVSSITSNFNGTAIPAGDYLWFSSVAKVSGLGTTPATVHVTDQTISFTANGTQYSLDVPDSTIVFDPANTSASADFTGGWQVASPSSFSGNVFLSGLSYQLTSRLPGGVKNVVWSGDFTSDTAGLKINWQWAAAAYSQFSSDSSAAWGQGVGRADQCLPQFGPCWHARKLQALCYRRRARGRRLELHGLDECHRSGCAHGLASARRKSVRACLHSTPTRMA